AGRPTAGHGRQDHPEGLDGPAGHRVRGRLRPGPGAVRGRQPVLTPAGRPDGLTGPMSRGPAPPASPAYRLPRVHCPPCLRTACIECDHREVKARYPPLERRTRSGWTSVLRAVWVECGLRVVMDSVWQRVVRTQAA